TLNPDGSYTYLADNANSLAAGATAIDTFSYTAKDPGGLVSNSTTLSITITGTNDAPETNAGSGSGNEDVASIAVSLSGSDVDGTVASFRINSLPSNGTLYSDAGLTTAIAVNGTVAASGNAATVYFVPNANFNGTPTFQYAAIDNNGAQDATPATATITVTAVNDAPVGFDDAGSATEAGGINNGTPGSNATGNVLTNDTDIDNT